ncbi:hypothetical protein [Streptomyces sp. NPDC056987]|uniref:hypothetical protein n=1 Tax=Streptomyces sp. NPDC056987 TaxID=3345988 RepID=UPI003640AB56
MDAIQQHMLDSYRTARRGETAPPLPGRYDRETVRTIREYRRTHRATPHTAWYTRLTRLPRLPRRGSPRGAATR